MKHWLWVVTAMLGLGCVLLETSLAEVVQQGQGQVTRYAVVEGDAEPAATGELMDGGVTGVRVAVAGQNEGMRLSLAEARSVHELLGHMLAVGAAAEAPAANTADEPEPDQTEVDSKQRPFIGMNLAGVTYWSREWAFTDLMLMSDAWRDNGRGYIYKAGYAPPGQYICTWMGSGSIQFSGDATAAPTGSNGADVTITSGDQGIDMQKQGDVSSVTLMQRAYETRVSPFHPAFLKSLEPCSVLRFMDWAGTNNSTLRSWSDRPRKGQQTQTQGHGVAIEYMIQLCNELDADAWYCMPHMADDDYIRKHAELVKDRLHKDAKVYIEYSNEVWNSQFKQHDYIRGRGDGKTYSPAFFDAWAERCRNTFDIWTQVFGDEADTRLVRVAAVHLQNPWVGEQLLPRLNGKFDAVAPSAYFGVSHKQTQTFTAQTSVDQLLDQCEENLRKENLQWYQRHGKLAQQWSAKLGRPIRLISYEAGQHLTAYGDDKLPYYDILIDAQTNPRMYGLYLLNMRLFEMAGGDLYTAFNDVSRPGKFGSWGHLAYQDQPIQDAPKYRALLEYPTLKK